MEILHELADGVAPPRQTAELPTEEEMLGEIWTAAHTTIALLRLRVRELEARVRELEQSAGAQIQAALTRSAEDAVAHRVSEQPGWDPEPMF